MLGLSLILALASVGSVFSQTDSSVTAQKELNDQTVDTTIGRLLGGQSKLRPDVTAYLGIPFARPPVGDLRFAKAVISPRRNDTINATTYGLYTSDCPQVAFSNPILPAIAKLFSPTASGQIPTGKYMDEDCLTINVWTKPEPGKKKPVLFWVYGGSFQRGSARNAGYDGSVLADENDVIVVSANYRLNIFGFPNAPGLPTNLALWDQRLALEWTRDNIEKFGGDPSRITMFSQSAGSIASDIYMYAFDKDPIINAAVLQSGSLTLAGSQPLASPGYELWYKISKKLDCGGSEAGPEQSIACVRSKPWKHVIDAISSGLNGVDLAKGFGPLADGVIGFPEYTTRNQNGQFAKVPLLVGNTDSESSTFALTAPRGNNGGNSGKLETLALFTCASSFAADIRVNKNIPVWRYRYYGVFPNTKLPLSGKSAYHGSELPLLFGTSSSTSAKADTSSEKAVSVAIRKAWAGFAADPVNFLPSIGWPPYRNDTASLVTLGQASAQGPVAIIQNNATDVLCPFVRCALEKGPVGGGWNVIGKATSENKAFANDLEAQVRAFEQFPPSKTVSRFAECSNKFPAAPVKFFEK